jgi:hypothetical protein
VSLQCIETPRSKTSRALGEKLSGQCVVSRQQIGSTPLSAHVVVAASQAARPVILTPVHEYHLTVLGDAFTGHKYLAVWGLLVGGGEILTADGGWRGEERTEKREDMG